jgi:hypothetical protein
MFSIIPSAISAASAFRMNPNTMRRFEKDNEIKQLMDKGCMVQAFNRIKEKQLEYLKLTNPAAAQAIMRDAINNPGDPVKNLLSEVATARNAKKPQRMLKSIYKKGDSKDSELEGLKQFESELELPGLGTGFPNAERDMNAVLVAKAKLEKGTEMVKEAVEEEVKKKERTQAEKDAAKAKKKRRAEREKAQKEEKRVMQEQADLEEKQRLMTQSRDLEESKNERRNEQEIYQKEALLKKEKKEEEEIKKEGELLGEVLETTKELLQIEKKKAQEERVMEMEKKAEARKEAALLIQKNPESALKVVGVLVR